MATLINFTAGSTLLTGFEAEVGDEDKPVKILWMATALTIEDLPKEKLEKTNVKTPRYNPINDQFYLDSKVRFGDIVLKAGEEVVTSSIPTLGDALANAVLDAFRVLERDDKSDIELESTTKCEHVARAFFLHRKAAHLLNSIAGKEVARGCNFDAIRQQVTKGLGDATSLAGVKQIFGLFPEKFDPKFVASLLTVAEIARYKNNSKYPINWGLVEQERANIESAVSAGELVGEVDECSHDVWILNEEGKVVDETRIEKRGDKLVRVWKYLPKTYVGLSRDRLTGRCLPLWICKKPTVAQQQSVGALEERLKLPAGSFNIDTLHAKVMSILAKANGLKIPSEFKTEELRKGHFGREFTGEIGSFVLSSFGSPHTWTTKKGDYFFKTRNLGPISDTENLVFFALYRKSTTKVSYGLKIVPSKIEVSIDEDFEDEFARSMHGTGIQKLRA